MSGDDNNSEKPRSSYAVFKTGGKQYGVRVGQNVDIEKIPGEPGDLCTFDYVIMVTNGVVAVAEGNKPLVGAFVEARIVKQYRAPKVMSFKKRRRKNSKRKKGHKQHKTEILVVNIVYGQD